MRVGEVGNCDIGGAARGLIPQLREIRKGVSCEAREGGLPIVALDLSKTHVLDRKS
jgi:hypothetical protein